MGCSAKTEVIAVGQTNWIVGERKEIGYQWLIYYFITGKPDVSHSGITHKVDLTWTYMLMYTYDIQECNS